MTPEVAVDLFREGLWLICLMVGLLVMPSLLVGLVVAMFQAATQINEQTLSFLPRLLVMLLTLIVAGPWICLLYTSPSPRDVEESRMPSSA